MLCFFCTLAAFTHSHERVNRKAATNKTLVERARNIEKLEKTTKLSLSSSFHISMWIAIHSFMFHYNLMSGRFYGAGPARVAHWSFGEDLVSSEKKLLFPCTPFSPFSIGQAEVTLCVRLSLRQKPQYVSALQGSTGHKWSHGGSAGIEEGGYSWLLQPPHSHTPIPMGWFVLVYANSPFA